MASFNLKEKLDFGALIKKYSIVSLVFAVIGLAIGVLFIISPLFTHSIFIWIALGLIALIGLYAIIRFIVPGKGKPRDGFSFAFGILVVAAFAILLVCALLTPAGKVDGEQLSGFAIFTLGLVRFFAIFFGVVAVFYSIWELCMIGNVEKGKKIRTIEPVFMYKRNEYESNPEKYCIDILNLNDPVIIAPKILTDSLLEIDGMKLNVSGRSDVRISCAHAFQLVLGQDEELQIKAIQKYIERCKAAKSQLKITEYDGINEQTNIALYDAFTNKLTKALLITGAIFALIYQLFNLLSGYFLLGYDSYRITVYSILRLVIGLIPAMLFLCIVFYTKDIIQQYQLLSGALIASGVVDFVLRILTAAEKHLDTSQIVNFIFFGNMEAYPNPSAWVILIPGLVMIAAAILLLKREKKQCFWLAFGFILALSLALIYDLYGIVSILDYAIYGPLLVLYFVSDTLSLLFLLAGSLLFLRTHSNQ